MCVCVCNVMLWLELAICVCVTVDVTSKPESYVQFSCSFSVLVWFLMCRCSLTENPRRHPRHSSATAQASVGTAGTARQADVDFEQLSEGVLDR